jgi:hypothetical protein
LYSFHVSRGPDGSGQINRRATKATILPAPPPHRTTFWNRVSIKKLALQIKQDRDALDPMPALKCPHTAMATPPSRMTRFTTEASIRPRSWRERHQALEAPAAVHPQVLLGKFTCCPRVSHPRRDFKAHFGA